MAGVFESYEQQFASITADITARIGRIPNLTGSEWREKVEDTGSGWIEEKGGTRRYYSECSIYGSDKSDGMWGKMVPMYGTQFLTSY